MNQATLSKKLSNVAKAVSTQTTLPILSHVLFLVKDGTATLASCNLEMFIIERFEIDSANFECCVPERLFSDLVNALEGDIKLTFKNDTLLLNEKAKIKTMPTMEFPELPILPEIQPVQFKSAELKYIITHTVYATPQNDARPSLCGIHFDFDDKVYVSASDGFRAAYCNHSMSVVLPSVTIPSAFSKNLASALPEKQDVNMWVTDSQVIFEFGNTIMVTQFVVGNFPNLEGIIPTTHIVSATVDVTPFLKALKIVKVLAGKTPLIRIDFNNDNLTLFAETPQQGECTESVNADVKGESYSASFDARFVLDVLERCKGTVVIEQGGAAKPFLFYVPGEKSEECHVVMPLYLTEKPDEN